MQMSVDQLHRDAVKALNRGNLSALKQLCGAILKQDPEHADSWFMLSIAAASAGQVGRALELINRAVALAPDQTEFLTQKARYHTQLHQFRAAQVSADRSLERKPVRALTLDTLGVVYSKLEQHEKAATAFRLAVTREPDNAQFQFNLGSAEQFIGHQESARAAYEQAIALKPDFARAHWALSELGKTEGSGGQKEVLQEQLQKSNLSSENQLYLSHALFREYEREGDYAGAFEILQRAKTSYREKIGYDFSRDQGLFSSLEKTFPAQRQSPASPGEMGQEMIFVVGMPRSGTTLVERILHAHSQVHSLGELQDFPLTTKIVSDTRSNTVLDPQVIEAAGSKNPSLIGEQYLARIAERSAEGQRFIDKLPMNFLYLGFILEALPEAKVICLQRHPLDTCLSNYRQLFAFGFHYYHYNYDLRDTARYICGFYDLMTHWKRRYGNRIYEVEYETLTAQPESEARSLVEFTGLGWEPECLDFHSASGAVSTASTMQVRQPIHRNAVERWRKYEKQLEPAIAIFSEAGLL